MAFRLIFATVFLHWCGAVTQLEEGAVVQLSADPSDAALAEPPSDVLLVEDEPGVEESIVLAPNSGFDYVSVKSQPGGLYAAERRLAEQIPENDRLNSATMGSIIPFAARWAPQREYL